MFGASYREGGHPWGRVHLQIKSKKVAMRKNEFLFLSTLIVGICNDGFAVPVLVVIVVVVVVVVVAVIVVVVVVASSAGLRQIKF